MTTRKSNEYTTLASVALPGPNPERLWTLLHAEDDEYEGHLYARPAEGAPMPVLSIMCGLLTLQLDPNVSSYMTVGPITGSHVRTGLTFSNAEGSLNTSPGTDLLYVRLPAGKLIELRDFEVTRKPIHTTGKATP